MKDVRIAIIGLGYVGLPLAVEFGKATDTVGFDINCSRLEELRQGRDHTLEVDADSLRRAVRLIFSSDPADLRSCNYYIVTVPTPIDAHNNPDLRPLIGASETVGQVLSRGDIVIYESTVYPGCTEEDCVPILEKNSGLRFNVDFFCGYSPERINPGDKEHSVTMMRKVVSGSTPETLEKVNALYSAIITAGTYRASSIKVAEAAKVIENSQRDINIAFVNELSLIFQRLGIDTHEVLAAAGTKWNFMPFRPGLVGGHCIGVDPYYLTFKAQSLGYHPEVILAGRRINDGMGAYVAQQVIKLMIRRGHKVGNASVLVLGITFKENCPDIRNSRVVDIIRELGEYGCRIDIHDPWANAAEVKREYGLELTKDISGEYEAVILAVSHRQFTKMEFARFTKTNTVIYDVKGVLDNKIITGRL
jgi:UDP-N-acetyl-D-galactosamine dehydrogenase